MFTRKMRIPALSAEPRAIGRLPEYVLRFNKRSDDGSGKGNVVWTGNPVDEVCGVIFEVEDQDRASLDASEGGYTAVEVEVLTAQGPQPAVTYLASAGRVNNSLRPYTWYKEYIVRGARAHGLPGAYIEGLQEAEADRDPDNERERRNLAFIEEN